MSVTLEKLRALKREAGLRDSTARANLPQPLFFKEGSQAVQAAAGSSSDGRQGLEEIAAGKSQTLLEKQDARASGVAVNAQFSGASRRSPLFVKEGPGEIRPLPAREDATASLRRLLGARTRAASVPIARGPIDRTLPGEEIAPGLRLIEAHLPYPAPRVALSLAFAKRENEAVDPRALLFFDSETTGLAGGTGTRAFMIGAADWHRDASHGDGLRIRQLLITTLAAEPAMLRAFAGWLTPATVLSSYNGRCFDAPLLKTRYRLARLADPITPLDHVDLLFPTRRRYRGTWENCRLATIERELLRIVREDDLPGSEAPAAWLSFLRGGSSRNLCRVAAHNHQDVVTLARLMTRLVAAQAADEIATAAAVFT